MWSNLLSDSLISSSAVARERFHKAFEDAQQTVDRHMKKNHSDPNNSNSNSKNEAPNETPNENETKSSKPNIAWASNIMDATRNTFQATRRVIEDEVAKASIQIPSSLSKLVDGDDAVLYRSRDLALPLDSDALRDADVVYITDRIICMGHPAMSSNPEEEEGQPYISAGRKLSAVSHLLRKRHGEDNFMIWNLSEVEYDTSNVAFYGQLLMYRFPGSPTP
eukprot:CAMPEP_0116055426 /NCGR_PEP_ID=MMETSP0322-20121206/3403_1 /TAXON_ID=163516 /ORGANISM="Leptocylindrus danicus var. apora, Strain B651" /LENGTH=220 /DNA_ID=CAMNT_0003539033 /DNA_START=27 /DNA_END=685 /DNA_ORIENTATION=-